MITDIKTKILSCRFEELNGGDVFRTLDGEEIFFKFADGANGKSMDSTINCVCLDDGVTCWIDRDESVIKIEGRFSEEGYSDTGNKKPSVNFNIPLARNPAVIAEQIGKIMKEHNFSPEEYGFSIDIPEKPI